MKTFSKLTINDTFYKVWTDYRGKEKPSVQEIKVKKIEIREDSKLR